MKIYRTICGIIAALAFLVLIGTVGALERDYITLERGIYQIVIALPMFAFAAQQAGAIRI